MSDETGRALWRPSAERMAASTIARFASSIAARVPAVEPATYETLWRWSVTNFEDFWLELAQFFAIDEIPKDAKVLTEPVMPGAKWFPDVELNFVTYALRRNDTAPALTFAGEGTALRTMSFAELHDEVARTAAALRSLGVNRGDRVVGMLPNIPHAVIAFLATASLGAIWSCCPPDFGSQSIIDRFSQLNPKVFITVDGYTYGGRSFDRRAVVSEIRREIRSIDHTIVVPQLDLAWNVDKMTLWDDLGQERADLTPVPVAFDDPLWILFSSGTTGLPKAIVHSHGGMLLEQLKGYGLHADVGLSDKVFWFGSTGWAVWNLLVSALVTGAGIVLYDGNPTYPDVSRFWEVTSDSGASFLGAGAPLFHATKKAGYSPADAVDLSSLRTIASTGSPLSVDAYAWFYTDVHPDVMLASMSGGTDICSAFVGACPLLPVRVGEIQCRWLGADVHAFDEGGHELIGAVGELVVSSPMPCMPTAFWNDPGDKRYHDSYFDKYPGFWRHGDWITIDEHGACVVHGRSDATLKRSGVRMGTGDFYAVVERMPDVISSVVVDTSGQTENSQLLLFVALRKGAELSDALDAAIRQRLRDELSPRHVPDRIFQVAEVPTTLTGKKIEVPLKRILGGATVSDVVSLDSLANPHAVAEFEAIGSELRG
jgi:acetoacetyl-CoA synthetase